MKALAFHRLIASIWRWSVCNEADGRAAVDPVNSQPVSFTPEIP